MSLRFLADTSAIARIQQRKASPRWQRAVSVGIVGICDPVELEVLRWVAGGPKRRLMQQLLRTSYPWVPVPDDVWQRARVMQDLLGDRSQHNAASVVDLVVAVTAARRRLTVLHDDSDYAVISRVAGVLVQRVME